MRHRREFLASAALLAASAIFGSPRRARRAAVHRRVVTAVDESGRSAILHDGEVPSAARMTEGAIHTSDLWRIMRMPADLSVQADPMADYTLTAWPAEGTAVARIATWPPGFEYPMHASDTVDILFVISGAIELILERGTTVLRAGDSVIQQGTRHGWRVIGNEPVTFAGVLVSGRR